MCLLHTHVCYKTAEVSLKRSKTGARTDFIPLKCNEINPKTETAEAKVESPRVEQGDPCKLVCINTVVKRKLHKLFWGI